MKEDLIKFSVAETKANSLLFGLKTFTPDLYSTIDEICKDNFDEGLYEYVRTEAINNNLNEFNFCFKNESAIGFITIYDIENFNKLSRKAIRLNNGKQWLKVVPIVTIKIYDNCVLTNVIEYFVDKRNDKATVYRKNSFGVCETTQFELDGEEFREVETNVVEQPAK